jgi:PAS domain S-box-containing protein
LFEQDQKSKGSLARDEHEHLVTGRLLESEARFRALADSAPVLIWVNGVDAGCEFVNKAYLEFFGKTLAEVQGFGWRPHAHPDDEERYVSAYLAAFRARAPFRCQARFRNAEGEYRWLDSVGHPRFAPSGEFLGYVGASPDITDSKRAELCSQFLSALDLALGRSVDPDEIVHLATSKLGAFLEARACHVGEIDLAAGMSIVRARWEGWLRDGLSLVGVYNIDDYVSPAFREALAAGEMAIVEDIVTDPRTHDYVSANSALAVRASLSMPVFHENEWRATVTVIDSRPRRWRPDEIQLVRDVAARLWLAVTKARSLEALRESERRAKRTLTDQMLAGVVSVDWTRKLTMVNRRYCDITGYDEGELLRMSLADLTHPDDWSRSSELHRRLFESGDGFFIEERYRRKDGAEIWINSHTSALRGALGDVEASVSVIIDVTDRKRVDEELATAKNRMAADLTALRTAYEQADAATRAKDEFLAVVSHELRSPLSAMLGYARLLGAEPNDPERVRQTAEIIERNGKAQVRLIEDLLDTGRIISGKLKLELRSVDLAGLVARAVDVVRPEAQAKGIELAQRLEPSLLEVAGDPDRLEQVVWNLLSNAVKFTGKGGRVDVSLERRDDHAEIVVRDTGKGMEPHVLLHMFERFWQGDMSSARRAGGLGLGLPLVKDLVELHGGTVAAASPGTNRGATFIVRLPVRAHQRARPEPGGAHPPRAPLEAAQLPGVRVVVVDDNEDIRAILALMLKRCGAEAVAVDSGREARELLARPPGGQPFDLLICDIGMPQEDGYQVIRRVRASRDTSGLPAIALTAYGRAEDRVRALKAGFQSHITKPIDPEALVATIRDVLDRFGPSGRSNPDRARVVAPRQESEG